MRQIRFVLEPIRCLNSGTAIGAEALLRIRDRTGALMGPDEFREELLQHAFREHVLFEAVERSMFWMAGEPRHLGFITINIDPVELANTSVIETLVGLVRRNGGDCQSIRFELVERFDEVDLGMLQNGARLLANNGISLFIDDFGSGYRPFSYLVELPVSGIKIDRSVIQNCAGDACRQSLLTACSTLAKSLSIEVIAEGIENLSDEHTVQNSGIWMGQGYLYGSPTDHIMV